MKNRNFKTIILVLASSLLLSTNIFSQNKNFYIYLCFGQSNMEGQGTIETIDRTVDSRFKMMSALNCSNSSRVKGTWYTATPPTCQCYSRLSPADYFGRTMVANLPDSITVGIINVSIGGCDIRIFDKDIYMDYDSTYTESWFTDKVKAYNDNPYQYLIDLALLAQQDGVIKGILLHQGETNTGNTQWPQFVNKIYNDMLTDLSLTADSVPLLAGQVVSSEFSGCCSSMNNIINTLPNTIPTAHVISSSGCTDQTDNAHFDSKGYRKLGRRYGVEMLNLLGYKAVYTEAECGNFGSNFIVRSDKNASNTYFSSQKTGVENLSAAPTNDSDVLQMSFTVSSDTTYYVYGRFNNASTSSDSYWVKIDNGAYELCENLTTTGWQWLELKSYDLTAGDHTISIGIAENGASLDKIAVKNSQKVPVDVAEEATTICVPPVVEGINQMQSAEGYSLEQNYPQPFSKTTSIDFEIPKPCYVSLKVYNSLGVEVAELGGKGFNTGKHTVKCNLEKLPAGNYYYTLKTDSYTATKSMIMLDK